MRPARASSAVLTALLATALTWFLLDLWTRQGGRLLPLPWFTAVALVVVAVVVAVLGWEVRRSVRGERATKVDPLAAARVVVLAKAAVYGGAVLVGWYGGQALVLLSAPEPRRDRLVVAVVTAATAAALAVAGLLAQRWCRLPPDDEGLGAGPPDGEDEALAPPSQHGPHE